MVQPYNYSLQGVVSPFESVVQGLKLGATLEEMEAARAQRTAQADMLRQQALLAEQKRQEELQKQQFMTGFFTRARNNEPLSVADWTEFGQVAASPEMQKIAAARIQNLTEEQQSAQAGDRAQAVVSLWRNPEIGLKLLEDRARANPENRALRDMLTVARADPKSAAAMLYAESVAYGGKIGETMRQAAETLGMKPEAKPEAVRILEAAGQSVTMDNIARLEAAKRGPSSDIQTMQALGIPITEDGFKRYQEIQAAGRGPLVSVTAGGQPTPPTEFEKKLEGFAADVYQEWVLKGGASNARARIAQLQDVVGALEKSASGKGATLSGVTIQATPEFLRPLLFPQAVEARQNAERVFQDGLRAILGAQFTQVEGENFLKRAFDPALGPDVNARRASLILEQMKESAKQAQALADYVEKNGTSRGFKGVLPSISQFEAILSRVPAQRTGAAGAAGAATAPPGTAAAAAAAQPGPAAATTSAQRQTVTNLPMPANQNVPLPGGARAGAAPGGGVGTPIVTPGDARARRVDEILQQYRSRP
jgi:hypothetical protein